MKDYLEFEKPLRELEERIDKLAGSGSPKPAVEEEIRKLKTRLAQTEVELYAKLTPWQRTQLARHPQRPGILDYLNAFCRDFVELHGDRAFGDDQAVVGGFARFNNQSIMAIGHMKGKTLKERMQRNFGMPNPEGYRKALRLMKLAEKFGIPVFTFVDTPGAYPGVGAEERGQSEAIGRNLYAMAELRVPIICTVIGEGGSGGALAIAVGDVMLMLQYATFSVISPEGCASILWKSADFAAEAAETLGITATRLKALGLVDKVVNEPLGGAHRDHDAMLQNLRKALQDTWRQLRDKPVDDLVAARFDRLVGYGKFKEVESGR